MASDAQHEVYRAHRELQNKYTYFLLASVGAAIGFALNQTQDASIAWNHLPLGIAVLLWGGSFCCGCYHLGYVDTTLYANSEMLWIEAGMHPGVGNHPQYVQAASEGICQAIEHNSDAASRLGHWQFRLLIAGAIFYILWHVLEMSLRAVS